MVQSSIRHLIVKHRLNDEREISILTHQYPNIKYLKLLIPLDQSVYIRCLKSVFSRDESLEKKNCCWSQLIYFTIEPNLKYLFCDDMTFHDWLIENTDLKYHKYPFYVQCSRFNISIWL